MSKKTIGIAICAYKGHIPHLKQLFNSIESQTRKPDQVVVSCSSCSPEDIPYSAEMYSFPFSIIAHSEKKNAAQNRNCAAFMLTTDIISFFDADDSMHPQRLEMIEQGFLTYDIKLFVHNTSDYAFQHGVKPHFFHNALVKCPWGSTKLVHSLDNVLIHNSASSVSRDVFQRITFHEGVDYQAREDTIFNTEVIVAYPYQTLYCHTILSNYRPSRTMDIF